MKKTKKKSSNNKKITQPLKYYYKDIVQISSLLNHINKNIKINYENVEELYYIPSYYKVFLLYVYDFKHNQSLDKKLTEQVNTVCEFLGKDIKNTNNMTDINTIYKLNLQKKTLTKFNNLVEDKCPDLLLEFQHDLLNNYETLPQSILKLNIPEEHRFLYNTFISFDNIETIRKCCKYKINVEYTYQSQTTNQKHYFIIYLPIKDKETLFNKSPKMISLLKEVATRLAFFNIYLKTEKKPLFTIYYSNLKKKITINPAESISSHSHNHSDNHSHTPTIRPININTAATDTKTKIIIWRKEELLKSIYHESIHFHNLDIRDPDYEKEFEKVLKSLLNITPQSEVFIREAYTECIANLLNIISYLTFKKQPLKNNASSYKVFIKHLNKEKTYSIEKVVDILRFSRFTRYEDLIKSKTEKSIKSVLNQNTPALSYYIIKSAFLHNIDAFLGFNNKTQLELSFNTTNNTTVNTKQSNFLLFVKNLLLNDKKWIHLINKKMGKQKTKKQTKSMKMTYLS